jgi:hypothetical protein
MCWCWLCTATTRSCFMPMSGHSRLLLKNSTLKTYKGFPHGMPTTEANTINADLLAFAKGTAKAAA